MTAARPSSDPTNPPGATPVGGGNRGGGRKRGLLLGALALGILIIAALLLSQCGNDDDTAGGTDDAGSTSSTSSSSSSSSSSPSSSSPSSPSSSASSAPSTPAAGSGRGEIVTAGGDDVLQLAAGADAAAALGGLSGQPVTGTAVRVLSVPADEGFWVGSSDQDRVWVQLTGEAGESPYQVTEGDVVDFEGTVVAHDPSFASTVGVDAASGAAQLTERGSHLEVAKSAVTLTA